MNIKKEPLQKLAYAWLFFIIVIIILLALYFFKPVKCVSTDFQCSKIKLNKYDVRVILYNNLHDVEATNLSASCRLDEWGFNGVFNHVIFEQSQLLTITLKCHHEFKDLNITLYYRDFDTNETHTDSIAVKR